jgi:hypothetical protein
VYGRKRERERASERERERERERESLSAFVYADTRIPTHNSTHIHTAISRRPTFSTTSTRATRRQSGGNTRRRPTSLMSYQSSQTPTTRYCRRQRCCACACTSVHCALMRGRGGGCGADSGRQTCSTTKTSSTRSRRTAIPSTPLPTATSGKNGTRVTLRPRGSRR